MKFKLQYTILNLPFSYLHLMFELKIDCFLINYKKREGREERSYIYENIYKLE